MNERKNVNTSFRKAIQQSALKSNLTEDSLQLRPIVEQQNYNGIQQQHQNHQQFQKEVVVQERAQRALDQLMEATGGAPQTNNSNPNVYNRVQQFSSGYPSSSSNHQIPQGSRLQLHLQQQQQPSHLRSSYNNIVKPGPASSNSNSSSGLQIAESSLSSPGSYTGINGRQLAGNDSHLHNSQWAFHLHHQQQNNNNSQQQQLPPPLPTSKKPDPHHQQLHSISPEGSINTIGLPLPSVELRENGDGSSATMETTNASSSCSKVKSDQLKQITTDLQNIALSVAAEQHLHNSSNHNNNHSSSSECGGEKGPQRVGSGQSHTTTDSGLGTVMLTKSPLNSNSDAGGMMIHQDVRPNADSLSSGKLN
jgi:hypothetical protein